MKNFRVFSPKFFFSIFISLKKTRQYIYCFICFVLITINLKIIFKKLINPTNLFKAKTLFITKSAKIAIIDEQRHLIYASF